MQHSWPQQMALDVSCFNCGGCVCSVSRKRTTAETSMFFLLDQKCKLGRVLKKMSKENLYVFTILVKMCYFFGPADFKNVLAYKPKHCEVIFKLPVITSKYTE